MSYYTTKRNHVKLEKDLSVVKGLLESIHFEEKTEYLKYGDGSVHEYYVGQPAEQIKNKIKVARALLMDISKEDL